MLSLISGIKWFQMITNQTKHQVLNIDSFSCYGIYVNCL